MPKNIEVPLHFCQVLEEEFESLHGTLNEEQDAHTIVLDDGSEITVERDWDFHDGHVLTDALAERLRNARQAWEQSHDRKRPTDEELQAERDLATYLVFETGLLDALDNGDGYIKILSGILADKDGKVFKKGRFERLPSLRDETRGLLEVGWSGDSVEFDDEGGMRSDLVRFRRLLLEDAFPDGIRRAYDLRAARVVRKVHELKTGRSAICLSGGGIRSGTFALGVIQSLAVRGLLDKLDYLSTVSGGGYIGGWLSAWIHRHQAGLGGVIADLKGETRDTKLEPEPRPLRHLRDFSSFVTPRTGLLSADTWTFVVIYIRNLLLNWVVLVPLAASVLMIPRVSVSVLLATPSWNLLWKLLLAGNAGILLLKRSKRLLIGLVLADAAILAVIFISRAGVGDSHYGGDYWNAPSALLVAGTLLGGYAIAYMRLNRPSNAGVLKPGGFWSRHKDQNSFLWLCLLPLCVSVSLLTTFWAWFRHRLHNADPVEVFFLGRGIPKFLRGDEFPHGFPQLIAFLFYGLLLGLAGWFIYLVLARSLKNAWHELALTLVGSVVGSLLLYAVAVNVPFFYNPVVEPFTASPFKGGGPPEMLLYSDWWGAEWYVCLAFPAYLFLFFLGITLYVGVTSRRSERSPKESRGGGDDWRQISLDRISIEDEDREWLARACAWMLIAAAGWLFFSLLVIFGPLLLFKLGGWLTAAGGVSGLVTLLGGGSSKTPGHSKKEGTQGFLATLGVNLVVVASFVFFACLVVLVSLLSGTLVAWLGQYLPSLPSPFGQLLYGTHGAEFAKYYPSAEHLENIFRVTHFPVWYYLFSLAVALNFFGQFFSRLINLNKFSLHAGYRDRIIRAFLGASRLTGERHPNPFTGFDPRDDLHVEELRPGLLRESDFVKPGGLAQFVAELNRPSNALNAPAKYIRGRIREIEGESNKYFQDPPGSIEFNPSFRSALFADLGRILQDDSLVEAAEFKEFKAKAETAYKALRQPRGDSRLMLNRMALMQAFPKCIEYPPPPYRLMHVVNMTLNLVAGKRLAWQQRRAESFTSTPLHSGSLFVGYRRTRDYGGKNGITLGTAVATSGAAASSNMGYFSPSPFVTLVLTFFNARLGWWLGNPGIHGSDTYFRSHPKKALSPILDEAFGLTDDTNPYVLLSDGGHFENLGLYEMVLRRCRHIIVVDGSADPEGNYDDLGGAVRKIRIDFGIQIEFTPPFLILSRPESEKKKGAYCAVGKIHYEEVDGKQVEPGTLIYVKPAIYGDEPRDIYNYARSHEDFPHESTADQFFDEPQFESHRMLGFYILESLFDASKTPTPPARHAVAVGPVPPPSTVVTKIPPPVVKNTAGAEGLADFFGSVVRMAQAEQDRAKASAKAKSNGGGQKKGEDE